MSGTQSNPFLNATGMDGDYQDESETWNEENGTTPSRKRCAAIARSWRRGRQEYDNAPFTPSDLASLHTTWFPDDPMDTKEVNDWLRFCKHNDAEEARSTMAVTAGRRWPIWATERKEAGLKVLSRDNQITVDDSDDELVETGDPSQDAMNDTTMIGFQIASGYLTNKQRNKLRSGRKAVGTGAKIAKVHIENEGTKTKEAQEALKQIEKLNAQLRLAGKKE